MTFLRTGTALAVVFLCSPAFADCLPNLPEDGDVVACTGLDGDGVNQDVIGNGKLDDVSVTVQFGAQVGNSATGEHAIELDDDAVVVVEFGADINATGGKDAVHLDKDGRVENRGVISAQDDAIQGDTGLVVLNTGQILAQDEGINAKDNAEIYNSSITAVITGHDDAVKVGQNAVIFNQGRIENIGTDLGDTQDAIDIDSGEILNQGGTIRSTLDAAIDFDADGVGTSRVRNVGAGRIEGVIGVETDNGNTATQQVFLEGTSVLTGTGGVAANLGKGADLFDMGGHSRVNGDVRLGDHADTAYLRSADIILNGDLDFGKGDDHLVITGDAFGLFESNWYQSNTTAFFGGAGVDILDFSDNSLFDFIGDLDISFLGNHSYGLKFGSGSIIEFYDFEVLRFAGSDLIFDVPPAAIPLPAGGILVLSGLLGLGGLRRLRRKAR